MVSAACCVLKERSEAAPAVSSMACDMVASPIPVLLSDSPDNGLLAAEGEVLMLEYVPLQNMEHESVANNGCFRCCFETDASISMWSRKPVLLPGCTKHASIQDVI